MASFTDELIDRRHTLDELSIIPLTPLAFGQVLLLTRHFGQVLRRSLIQYSKNSGRCRCLERCLFFPFCLRQIPSPHPDGSLPVNGLFLAISAFFSNVYCSIQGRFCSITVFLGFVFLLHEALFFDRNEPADNDVFLQPQKSVFFSLDGSFRQNTGGFLK